MGKTVGLVQPDGSVHVYDATGRDVHVDQPLTEILLAYRLQGSVADQIFPIVPVAKQHGMYYEFNQADWFRVEDSVRAPMTAAKWVDFDITSATYFAKNYAFATGVSIEDQVNADEVLRLRESKALFITDKLMLDWEKRVSALVINSSNVSTFTLPASGQWRNWSASDPVFDIQRAIETMRRATGYRANRMVIGAEAHWHLQFNATLRELIFPAPGGVTPGGGIPTLQQISNVFRLDQTVVADAQENTGKEGLPQTLSDLYGPNVLLYYAPPRPSRETPSFGYSFRWTAPGIANFTVEDLGFDRRLKGNILDIGYYQDEKVTGSRFAT